MKENRLDLSPGAQNQLESFSKRPTDPGGGIDGKKHLLPQLYNATNFVIHWTNGTDGGSPIDAVPLDDNNANGVPDYVENFAEIFENVQSFEVDIRGFPAPPSDEAEPNDVNRRNPDGRYDVFVYAMGYFGYAYPEQWPNSPSYSYIGVKDGYEGFYTPQLGAMQTVAAHEFFHAIQFYYDCTEVSWWLETSADYMEDEVYPDVNDNYLNLPEWFQFSDTHGLESTVDSHEYGNFIFAKRLSEDFGDNIIKEIWQEMQKPGINGLVAIDNVLISKNSTLVSEFSNFTTANFFLEDMYVDGADYRNFITRYTTFNGVWLEYKYNAATASSYTEINMTNVNRDAWMDRWAADYITMKLDPIKPRYNISFDGLDLTTNYLVKVVTKKEGVINETLFQLNSQKDGYLELLYDDYENVTLIIANAGNTATANPSWRVTITIPSEPPPPIYDVAITDLKPSTYYASPEETINISVTVKNNGTIRNEDFNVSAYWGQFLIETRQVIGLGPATTETLNITWGIPPELNGSEKLWANATIVPEDSNPGNNQLEDGMLRIAVGIHDVAVKAVTIPKNATGQGQSMEITITVSNQGTFLETVNVSVYLNETIIGNSTLSIPPEMDKEIDLRVNAPSQLEINLYYNYTLRVEVSPVPGEEDLENNTVIAGWIIITIPGDVDADKDVDLYDVVKICGVYGSRKGDPDYEANYDVNCDEKIDLYDVVIAYANYGKFL